MALVVKNPLANAGDIREEDWIPGWGRCPGGGNGNPLQNSCLENPVDKGAFCRLQSMGMHRVRHDCREHTCMHRLLLDILLPVCLTMWHLFLWETFQSNHSFLYSKIPRRCGLLDVFHSLQGNGACKLSSLSCVRLFATPWTIPGQTPLSMGFPLQEDWNG